MVPRLISAVDAVSPALEYAKRHAFKPFQWAKWWRIGLLGLITGEMSAGGCQANFNLPSDLSEIMKGSRTGEDAQHFAPASGPLAGMDTATIAAIISVAIVGAIVLTLVHMYLASTSRFILFDAITQNRYRLREGWRRWSARGLRFFWFYLAFTVIVFSVILTIMAPFIIVLWRALAAKSTEMGTTILFLLLTLPFLLVVGVASALYFVFAKDFSVPIMALEDVSFRPAMARVWQMIKVAKADFAAYIGMKIVLTIGYGIVLFIVQLILLIPVLIVIVVIAVALGISAPSLFANPLMLALLITAMFFLLLLFMVVVGIIAAPAVMFFQAYSLIFFAPRYLPLYYMLYGAPPPEPPPASEPPPSPQSPPPFPPELAPTS
jgi:hypothetical protein